MLDVKLETLLVVADCKNFSGGNFVAYPTCGKQSYQSTGKRM